MSAPGQTSACSSIGGRTRTVPGNALELGPVSIDAHNGDAFAVHVGEGVVAHWDARVVLLHTHSPLELCGSAKEGEGNNRVRACSFASRAHLAFRRAPAMVGVRMLFTDTMTQLRWMPAIENM